MAARGFSTKTQARRFLAKEALYDELFGIKEAVLVDGEYEYWARPGLDGLNREQFASAMRAKGFACEDFIENHYEDARCRECGSAEGSVGFCPARWNAAVQRKMSELEAAGVYAPLEVQK